MKTRVDLTICNNLKQIMKQHCKCNNLTMSNFISLAVAEKLNIPLTEYSVSDEDYAKHQIKEIDNCIKQLEAKKREYEEELK